MSLIETWLFAPLAHEFMQRGLIVAVLVGVVCAVLSCFLILKGWSLMGDAISHAVLPGIVLAFVMGIPLIIGAFVSGLFCAFAENSVNGSFRPPQKRQPPVPETARTAGGCGRHGARPGRAALSR